MRTARLAATALALVAAAPACRSHDAPPPAPRAPPPVRHLAPAPGGVRPLPPHAIRVDGVGPYRLGRPLGEILADLPSGPSMAVLDIQGVVGCSVVRAEDGGVLIAGEAQGEASFVAVVRPDIARTESGIAVGAARKDLEAALGPALVDRARARDPRLWMGQALPGVRFLVEQDRVAAVLIPRGGAAAAPAGEVAAHPPDARPAPPDARVAIAAAASDGGAAAAGPPPACDAPPLADAIVAANLKPNTAATATPWCLGDAAFTAVAAGDAVTLVGAGGGSDERVKRLAVIDAPGLVYAATIAGEDDGDRDELAVVTERQGSDARVVEVAIYRWEGGKLGRVGDEEVYRLTAASARWIGARLEDIEVLVELEPRGEAVTVSGALVSRAGGEIRDVAPLLPVAVSRHRRAAAEGGDLDAGHPPSPAPDDARRAP